MSRIKAGEYFVRFVTDSPYHIRIPKEISYVGRMEKDTRATVIVRVDNPEDDRKLVCPATEWCEKISLEEVTFLKLKYGCLNDWHQTKTRRLFS